MELPWKRRGQKISDKGSVSIFGGFFEEDCEIWELEGIRCSISTRYSQKAVLEKIKTLLDQTPAKLLAPLREVIVVGCRAGETIPGNSEDDILAYALRDNSALIFGSDKDNQGDALNLTIFSHELAHLLP